MVQFYSYIFTISFFFVFPKVLPHILPFEFGEPVDALNVASVTCSVLKGDAPIKFSWIFNGKKIYTNDGVLITSGGQRISLLSIDSVRSRHAGNYTCIAENLAGVVQHTSELFVNG